MSKFNLNIPITKVDEEQGIVYGYATQEVLDRQGDIVDYEASKKAFSAWPGNIREQHDPKKAVGKNVHLEFDDDEQRVLIGAKLSQSTDGRDALTKVKEGILTGFSIGGKIYKTIRDTAKNAKGEDVNANRIMEYELTEVSLVDVPACPTAEFVMVKSVDGQLQQVEEMRDLSANSLWFNKAFAYSPSQVNRPTETTDNSNMNKVKENSMSEDKVEKVNVHAGEERDANAEPVVTVPAVEEKTVEKVNVHAGEERDANAQPVTEEAAAEEEVVAEPAEEAAEEPKKDKKKADEPEITKSLYSVAALAECLDCLKWIASDVEWESKVEGDASDVPAQLKAAVADVAKALAALAAEEATEAASDEQEVEVVELADQPTDLRKMVSDELAATQPDLVKSVVEAVSAKVTEQLKPLEERLKVIEDQPAGKAPVRQFAVVDKVADAQPSKVEELLKRVDEIANDPNATPAERTALALELRKAQRAA